MATLADVLTYSRAQAQTDSNGLTDANGILYANEALVDFRRRLISAGVDSSGLQESYCDTVAGTGTYLYPTNMFFLKAIEVKLSGSDYLTASQVDVSNLPSGSFSDLRTNQSVDSPLFDDRGDWYEIFPTPSSAVSGGIRIFYFSEPTEYTATTDTIAYPESLDSRTLGWRIASDYYYSLGKLDEAMIYAEKYEERVKQLISTLSRGVQSPIQATGLQIDGWSF